ncbi:putative beta-lysine N-acetyltransferase [Chlorobium phaeovibrioides]|uniref:Putative beta-lysine N-acetyltransferase n=1 Tax=Chlorobium phaeovibrioides TaxID=1094 RepID=A0A5M8IC43_CHLPH|nr:putative beta-lysine N-acetyltransferase [Chlorobium phaeovibrioides]KAA6232996.1 putative beta-lysine N-acetyltransferase [Chlorobium phaeovibrioides]
MKNDIIERRHGALIQHGPKSARIYVMECAGANPETLVQELLLLGAERGYGKIFAKVPELASAAFLRAGFHEEARIPGFFAGEETALFLALFIDTRRARSVDEGEIERIVTLAVNAEVRSPGPLPDGCMLRICTPDDIPVMSSIYREVFPTYPFPIEDPAWLLETMRTHVDYYGVSCEGRLVALASSEMDLEGGSVEMTDFATLPDWRGNALALHLLQEMEDGMRRKGMKTAYTIARALSGGMNITFARRGYRFSGTLVNNTNISGGIESMNVWFKPL